MNERFDLQGHRGARGLMPENTISGFRHALELGVTTLEMDVVISRDSQVVVSHEPWFSHRICLQPSGDRIRPWNQKRFRLFDMSYEEIAAFDCGSRGHPNFPRQKNMKAVKPLLRDVIAEAESYMAREGRPPVQYNIETKSRPAWDDRFHPDPETFVRLLYDVLQASDILHRATVQSFDMRTLRIMRELDSSVDLSLLVPRRNPQTGRRNRRSVREHIQVLGFTPEVYSPDYRLVDRTLLTTAHEHDMRVIPWTVNELETMKELKSLGVDGIITDYPDLGRELLE